ncbi:toxin CbtA, partial [Salmonella enterica subsp. enterica serovar Berta]|nr:toxin CbtA [Salmonella enterica subsp. enterica serovar Berta]
ARKACGLMKRRGYRAVTDITTGRYHQELKP